MSNKKQIVRYGAQDLHFDYKNPRLVESGPLRNEDEIITTLWDKMGVNEIVMSILANGFFENEALYAIEEDGKLVVVEGNRRLAAAKVILNPTSTGTNANHYVNSERGIPSVAIGIPQRNMHTALEVINIKDVDYTATLISKYILEQYEIKE